MVHVSRTFRPEVVMFGGPQHLLGPITIEAGKSILVKVNEDQSVTISRFVVGEADKKIEVDHDLANIIRGIIEIGGHYPDIVHMLHEADRLQALSSRFEIDRLPQVGRKLTRDLDKSDPTESEGSSTYVPNLFGQANQEEISDEPEIVETPSADKAEK